jgi:hypothetical protein
MSRSPASQDARWLALIVQLPGEATGARMAMLRTLETLGAAAMREGVYLLPDTAHHRRSLQHLSEYVASAEGHSEVTMLTSLEAAQSVRLLALFDRSAQYRALIKTLEGIESGIGMADPTAIGRVLGKQRREFERIRSLDFYRSELATQAEQRLIALEQRVHTLIFPTQADTSPPARPQRYFRRTWATRRPLLADRLASAWLIRRFIDPEATMIWLDGAQCAPAHAVGFAYENADFCNTRTRLTYEELLAHCGRNSDAALARIGLLVRALDVGDRTIAEAVGVETLLDGARRRATSEDELLRESEKTFDLLYEAYLDSPSRQAREQPCANAVPAQR